MRRPSGLAPLLGPLLGLLVLLGAAGPAAAEPALWAARGERATIYLFGTVHLLPPDARWRSPRLDAALAESRALWLEAADVDDPAVVARLLATLGFDPAHPLSSRLTSGQLARVDAAVKAAGQPWGVAMLQSMRPWLAAVTLSTLPVLKAGLDPRAGVDAALKARATANGQPVRAFETAEQQTHFFADLPEPLQVQFLLSVAGEASEGIGKIDALLRAWEAGDTATIGRIGDEAMRDEFPRLYQVLLVGRNRAWTERIAALLANGETAFVAVGAAHLAGPDSVQRMLEARGVRVERVN